MATHDKPAELGGTEYHWGPGMFPNPALDYDEGKVMDGVNRNQRTKIDQLREMAAQKRSNTLDPNETTEEMLTAAGNPDRYGPARPLVQQSPEKAPEDTSWHEPVAKFERKEY